MDELDGGGEMDELRGGRGGGSDKTIILIKIYSFSYA